MKANANISSENVGETASQRNYRRIKERKAADPEFRRAFLEKEYARRERWIQSSPDARKKHLASNRRNVARCTAKKKAVIAKAKGNTCSKCGGRFSKRKLHHHHVDPSTKQFSLADGHEKSDAAIAAELKKVVTLCEDCHMALHHPGAESRQRGDRSQTRPRTRMARNSVMAGREKVQQ